MIQISNASYENKIHRVDSPFKEDSKNIIFLLEMGWLENLGKMDKNKENYCYAD